MSDPPSSCPEAIPGRSVARASTPRPGGGTGARRSESGGAPPKSSPSRWSSDAGPETPQLGHHRPVHGDETVAVEQDVQRGDVAEAHEDLGRVEDAGGLEPRQEPHRPVPAPRAPDRPGLRVARRLVPLGQPARVVPGQVPLPGHDVLPHAGYEAEPFPQHPQPLLEGLRVERTGRGDDPDHVSPFQGWRLDHRPSISSRPTRVEIAAPRQDRGPGAVCSGPGPFATFTARAPGSGRFHHSERTADNDRQDLARR